MADDKNVSKASTEGKVLYELMFEDMSPAQFLKAAKKAVTKAKRAPSKCRILLIALLNWVDDNPIKFGVETAMGRLTELILRFDEDDDVDGDDILTFMGIIRDFFTTITPKDITNMENWEVSANMSPNLLALFGRPSKAGDDNKPAEPHNNRSSFRAIDSWKAPSKWGLGNSAPIFVSAKSAAQYTTSQRDIRDDDDDKPAKSNMTSPHAVSDPSPAAAESKIESSESVSSINRYDCKSAKGSVDDEDDDDEEDEDGSESELPKGMNMSLNLMRALGLDTTGMECETDWKPPSDIGIEANPDSYKL